MQGFGLRAPEVLLERALVELAVQLLLVGKPSKPERSPVALLSHGLPYRGSVFDPRHLGKLYDTKKWGTVRTQQVLLLILRAFGPHLEFPVVVDKHRILG